MKRVAFCIVLLLGPAACAGPGGVAPGGGLAYRVPDPASVTYLTGDTMTINIDAGPMGLMELESTGAATWAMVFAQGPNGVQVTATAQELHAEQSNPMAGSVSVTEEFIQGDVVFTMDKVGRSTVVSLPDLRGQAESLANPIGIVHDFFPRLPGDAVQPGAVWVDTLNIDTELSTGNVTMTSITTYTLAGDTVIDGVNLVRVTFEGEAERSANASQGGVETFQSVSGPFEGVFYWDPARALMVEFRNDVEMNGMVEVSAPGVQPMPVSLEGRSVIKLQGG